MSTVLPRNVNAVTDSTPGQAQGTVMRILGAVAFVHLLNDLIQALLPSIYPMLKAQFSLSFAEVGLITLTFQCTASMLQPWIGLYTCLLYTSPSPRDRTRSRMPSSA